MKAGSSAKQHRGLCKLMHGTIITTARMSIAPSIVQFDTFGLFQTIQQGTNLKEDQIRPIIDAFSVVLENK